MPTDSSVERQSFSRSSAAAVSTSSGNPPERVTAVSATAVLVLPKGGVAMFVDGEENLCCIRDGTVLCDSVIVSLPFSPLLRLPTAAGKKHVVIFFKLALFGLRLVDLLAIFLKGCWCWCSLMVDQSPVCAATAAVSALCSSPSVDFLDSKHRRNWLRWTELNSGWFHVPLMDSAISLRECVREL